MKMTYVCACGYGCELHPIAWRLNGSPRRARCWKCTSTVRYYPIGATPLEAAWHDLCASPIEAIGTVAVIALVAEGLLSGWLGRLIGAAAVMVCALPPGAR
jgi:hypothetical protein